MQVVEIEEDLLAEIDEAVKRTATSRTEFVRDALLQALNRQNNDEEKIRRFAESYRRQPQQPEEYEVWQAEQVWSEE